MIMLYASNIWNNETYENVDRVTISKKDIISVEMKEKGVFMVKNKKYKALLKSFKNVFTVSEFFKYISDYSEIVFETKEIPTKKEIKTGDVFHNNGKYFLVLGTEISHVHGIIQREIYFDITSITKDEIIKHWQNVGNLENDAKNIIAGYENFYNLIKEKEKDR